MTTVKLAVVNGALLQVPIYEDHQRGKNWLAVIDVDATMPGGLERDFLPYGRGDCPYIVSSLEVFSAVEFAADYVTSTGSKRPKRWFGVVVAKTADFLLLEQCKSGTEAVVRARAAKVSVDDKVRALEAELESCEARQASIRSEIEALRAPPAEAVRA